MKQQNLFFGWGHQAKFSDVLYMRLMSRQWFCYADVMAEVYPENNTQVSSCEGYGELKKLFGHLRKAITDKVGKDCIETRGNNRNKQFRYVGDDNDPLVEMRIAKTVNNLKTYWEFCQDSAGFFPMSWLEYFFMDCQDLLNIKTKKNKGEQVLVSSLDRHLKNIELLPYLYEAIKNKQVLSIKYKPFDEEERTYIFHPHRIKEFNGRWHLYGHAENQTPELAFSIALDRIVDKPKRYHFSKYKEAPDNFYSAYFENLVGVSHKAGEEPKEIIVRAHSNYIFKLTETKPIHKSQKKITEYGSHDDGEYGEFCVFVEANKEFMGRILQMGAGLEIVSPEDVRQSFKEEVDNLYHLYK